MAHPDLISPARVLTCAVNAFNPAVDNRLGLQESPVQPIAPHIIRIHMYG